MFDFGLEVGNIAVGEDDIRCLKEAVEGHVKLHGVLWEPDLVVVDHAESWADETNETRVALEWEVSNDTVDNSNKDGLNEVEFLSGGHSTFLFFVWILTWSLAE